MPSDAPTWENTTPTWEDTTEQAPTLLPDKLQDAREPNAVSGWAALNTPFVPLGHDIKGETTLGKIAAAPVNFVRQVAEGVETPMGVALAPVAAGSRLARAAMGLGFGIPGIKHGLERVYEAGAFGDLQEGIEGGLETLTGGMLALGGARGLRKPPVLPTPSRPPIIDPSPTPMTPAGAPDLRATALTPTPAAEPVEAPGGVTPTQLPLPVNPEAPVPAPFQQPGLPTRSMETPAPEQMVAGGELTQEQLRDLQNKKPVRKSQAGSYQKQKEKQAAQAAQAGLQEVAEALPESLKAEFASLEEHVQKGDKPEAQRLISSIQAEIDRISRGGEVPPARQILVDHINEVLNNYRRFAGVEVPAEAPFKVEPTRQESLPKVIEFRKLKAEHEEAKQSLDFTQFWLDEAKTYHPGVGLMGRQIDQILKGRGLTFPEWVESLKAKEKAHKQRIEEIQKQRDENRVQYLISQKYKPETARAKVAAETANQGKPKPQPVIPPTSMEEMAQLKNKKAELEKSLTTKTKVTKVKGKATSMERVQDQIDDLDTQIAFLQDQEMTRLKAKLAEEVADYKRLRKEDVQEFKGTRHEGQQGETTRRTAQRIMEIEQQLYELEGEEESPKGKSKKGGKKLPPE